MFSNTKLTTKLGIAFSVLVLITVCIGGLAIWKMATINTSTEDIATNWLPSITVLGQLRNTANAFRRLENRHILSVDDKEMNEIEQQMSVQRKTFDELMGKYKGLIANEEDRKLFEALSGAMEGYWVSHTKLIPLSRGGEKLLPQAKDYLRGESNAAFQKALEAQTKLVDLNDKGADESYKTAQGTYSQARMLLLGMLALALAIAVGLALTITRSILRQLGGDPAIAVDLANKMAAGDLSTQINLAAGDTTSLMARMKTTQASVQALVKDAAMLADAAKAGDQSCGLHCAPPCSRDKVRPTLVTRRGSTATSRHGSCCGTLCRVSMSTRG